MTPEAAEALEDIDEELSCDADLPVPEEHAARKNNKQRMAAEERVRMNRSSLSEEIESIENLWYNGQMDTCDQHEAETAAPKSPFLAAYNAGLSAKIETVIPTLTDPKDRQLVQYAHVFLECGNPRDYAQIKIHGDRVGSILAYMNPVDVPKDLYRMEGKLMALLCEHHIELARQELLNPSFDLIVTTKQLKLALDAAKSLAHPKGYEDPTLLQSVQQLLARLPTEDPQVASLKALTDEAIRKITNPQ